MSDTATARKYVLLRTLGEGSFGAVYLAQYESTGGFRRKVAIKLLHPGWNPDSDAGRRLRDEARLLGRIHHPNIVRVDDLTQLDGRWAVVMEHIPGRDLEAIVNHVAGTGARIPVRTALLLAVAVANALRAAWELRDDEGQPLHVVHRDIKPSNVLVSEIGEVKVLDFGIARATFEGREAKTSEVRYGSIGYMPPERITGENETISGDVYSLGVLAYELIVRESFGRSAVVEDAHHAQVERAMARLAPECFPVADNLVPIIRRMLAHNPADRPDLSEILALFTDLARRTEGPDLETWAREYMPKLPQAGDDAVKGSILAESNPRRVVASATIVVAGSDEEGPPAPVAPAMTDTFVDPGPAPRAFGPLALAAAGTFVVIVGLAAWQFSMHKPEAQPAPPAAAQVEIIPGTPAEAAAPSPPPPPIEPAAVPTQAEAPPSASPPPAAAATARPASPAPVRSPTPRPAEAPAVAEAPAPVAAPAALRLRSVKVTIDGGSGLSVRCGDRAGSGAASVLLRDVPAGTCTVSSGTASAQVTIDQPRGVACTLAGDALTCR